MSQKLITNSKSFTKPKPSHPKSKNSESFSGAPKVTSNPPAKPRPLEEKSSKSGAPSPKKQVSRAQIEKMLLKFGEFPSKHRFIIWKTLLQIPENKILFEQLLKKGEHPSIDYIKSRFPIADDSLAEDFYRVFSALGHWSPVVAESEFMPAVVFPFVKLSDGDLLGAFELSLSFIYNWMYDWFENFPNPPIRYLITIEDIIKTEDKALVEHLQGLKLSPSLYVWPIIKYMFTQVSTREEVCVIFDHILTYNSFPHFLQALSAGYILYYASTLKSLKTPHDIQGFFTQQNSLIVSKLIAKAQSLLAKTPSLAHRLPLLSEYPSLTNYPDFAISLQIAVREKLVNQDQIIQSKRAYIKSINDKFQKIEEDEYKLRREQEALIQAEIDRRKQSALADNIKLEERKKLDEDARKIRLSQIQRVEDTIQTALVSSEALKRKEKTSHEEELVLRSKFDSYEAAAAKEEENLSLLEFKSAARLLEVMRVKNKEESLRKLRQHADNWDREQDEKEKILKKQWEIENEQRRIDLEMMRETKLKEMELCKEYNNKRRMDTQQHLKSLERELKILDLEKEKKLRILAEEELMRNEEYLLQLKIKQELLREQDEREFQLLLAQEKEFKMKKNNEFLSQVREEQRKQALELSRAREENEYLEKELENRAVEDKIRQMREEAEVLERERERMVQETVEKIERERNEVRRVNMEIERKRKELNERNAYQKVVRDEVDEAIQREREQFWRFRSEVEQENKKIEEEKKRTHDRKMKEIVKQREETLAELSRPMPKVSSSLKDRVEIAKGLSENEIEPKSFNIRSESPEYMDEYKRKNYSYKKPEYLDVKDSYHRFDERDNFEIKEQYEESLSSSGKPNFYQDPSKSLEESHRSIKAFKPEERGKGESATFAPAFEAKNSQQSDYALQKFTFEDFKTKKITEPEESSEKKHAPYQLSDHYEDQSSEGEEKTYEREKREPETIKSQDMFDMKKISEFTKDIKTKKDELFYINPANFVDKMKKIEEEDKSYSKDSDYSNYRQERRRWDESSYSKCSSSCAESSELSYHKIDIPKENRFFISKTQKPDVDYSERWDEEGSESFSSCHSHECSSCVYSSSECSCDYSSKESSQKFISPGNYHYTSSEYSDDSYDRRKH